MISNNRFDLKVTRKWDFFEKSKFYSYLKQKFVTNEDYEDSKFLYTTLEIRNLNDMNDLYNAKDVILLCGIIESRFELTYQKYFIIQENVI